MCVNARWIFNPYSRQKVLVKCGKCESCLQEKALVRTQRIRNHVQHGYINLFITLTYANDYVPYVLRSELLSDSPDINVYRDCSCRFVFSRTKGLQFRKENGVSIIDSIYIPFDSRLDTDVRCLKHLNGASSDKIGVCLSSDIQKFFKRLRQILKRNYDIQYNFGAFYCSEYGSVSNRPHFHLLLSVKSSDEKAVRQAVLKAWPYADKSRTDKYIEIARDASNYVSSYVNGNNSLLPLLQDTHFRQKHNYTRNYGVVLDCFKLDSLLRKIQRGSLEYYREKKFDGTTSLVPVPIPAYVINRYFPKFKGFNRLSASQLRSILICPTNILQILLDENSEYGVYQNKLNNPNYNYSRDECYRIYVRLENAFQRFHAESGLNRHDYALYFVRAWNALFATNMRFLHCPPVEHDDIDYEDFYDNNLDVVNEYVKAPSLDVYNLSVNPNERVCIVNQTNKMRQIFSKKNKQRKVTNFIMTANGHFV